MTFTPSLHVDERWAERFPHAELAESFAVSRPISVGKLIHMLSHRPRGKRLKVKMGTTYRYDGETGALFIIGDNGMVVTVVDIGIM